MPRARPSQPSPRPRRSKQRAPSRPGQARRAPSLAHLGRAAQRAGNPLPRVESLAQHRVPPHSPAARVPSRLRRRSPSPAPQPLRARPDPAPRSAAALPQRARPPPTAVAPPTARRALTSCPRPRPTISHTTLHSKLPSHPFLLSLTDCSRTPHCQSMLGRPSVRSPTARCTSPPLRSPVSYPPR
jgi:hypothetical protein